MKHFKRGGAGGGGGGGLMCGREETAARLQSDKMKFLLLSACFQLFVLD